METVTQKFSNELSDAQAERLAILLEECGEAQQAIGKILRHGYESYNPFNQGAGTNREQLVKEIGDIMAAVKMMRESLDFIGVRPGIDACAEAKAEKIKPYLHHQEGG